MSQLSVQHLLGIKHLNKADIDLIFETADHFKECRICQCYPFLVIRCQNAIAQGVDHDPHS